VTADGVPRERPDEEKSRERLAVLASGRGTNLQAILEAHAAGRLSLDIVLVLSDRPAARALDRARAFDIPAEVLTAQGYPSREEYDRRLIEVLDRHGVTVVALAGFMRILSPVFLRRWGGRCLNIHPSLLPAFPGLQAQRQALDHGVKVSGCTVHFVDDGVDTGPIILQAAVPVLDDDDEHSLAERILVQEHILYPRALQLFAEGRLRVEGRKVKVIA